MSSPAQHYPPPAPSGPGIKTAVLVGAIVASLAANVYLYLQVDHMRADISRLRESVDTELTNVRETSSVTSAANRRHLDTLKDELESARRHASMAASQAKTEALNRAEQLANKLSAEQKRQEQEHQQVASELTQVKQVATTTNAKIADVSGDVNTVKTEVASTKSELERTISDLKKVTGDLGVQSGYIATNAKELALLRRQGERNYFEFKLGKSKQPQRVGDVTLLLKKTDPKHNKYTLEVLADDKKSEKKDRSVNEPVQFYVSKGLHEIVVNDVKKDQIQGYLSTPKDLIVRN